MSNRGNSAIGLFCAGLLSMDPAKAQSPDGEFSVTGGATLVSDYRYRGISQSDRRLALQGSFTLAHESGVYGSLWSSSIEDYVANGADVEIDFILGYRRTFGGTAIDGGLLYYHYPGSGGIDSDFFEPYLSIAHTFGPVTAKVSANYAPSQSAIATGGRDRDNLYLGGDLSASVPGTPVSLSAHIGHSFGPSYLTIADEYTDWSLGASAIWRHVTLGLTYVDTDGAFPTPSGRNASGAGVVASAGVSF
jgi:uncharacterized protein (TIGR02001 family)